MDFTLNDTEYTAILTMGRWHYRYTDAEGDGFVSGQSYGTVLETQQAAIDNYSRDMASHAYDDSAYWQSYWQTINRRDYV